MKECECNAEGSLASINPDHIKKRHAVFVGLVCTVQQEGIGIGLKNPSLSSWLARKTVCRGDASQSKYPYPEILWPGLRIGSRFPG
ncbi:hypothetical protein CHGG_04071 [Chaetomium globosum CBS 148.51]|uniref:Uncharacterized protein n=1 Tax=Chaetomium globosum (strain ATCC 6205 / CBS 148.51 / DSM 1962 / NBRC 6347 / NRRL 1970) TaxID=306901 RepID=Q2H2C5_CHAGB|nr:uncharacterized protein CHGG_04071 [Chaetomium globosum CBS 148.51]EAQ87452.1 hypothetical protein CHGG_04071 [Chaetomium globosum CBS 148.51]